MSYNASLLGGVNVITGTGLNAKEEKIKFQAIPYFALGNTKPGDAYKVWIHRY
jgi:hypothetical protein